MFSSFLNTLSKPPLEHTPVEVEDVPKWPISQAIHEMQSLHLPAQNDYSLPGAFSGPSLVCGLYA